MSICYYESLFRVRNSGKYYLHQFTKAYIQLPINRITCGTGTLQLSKTLF